MGGHRFQMGGRAPLPPPRSVRNWEETCEENVRCSDKCEPYHSSSLINTVSLALRQIPWATATAYLQHFCYLHSLRYPSLWTLSDWTNDFSDICNTVDFESRSPDSKTWRYMATTLLSIFSETLSMCSKCFHIWIGLMKIHATRWAKSMILNLNYINQSVPVTSKFKPDSNGCAYDSTDLILDAEFLG